MFEKTTAPFLSCILSQESIEPIRCSVAPAHVVCWFSAVDVVRRQRSQGYSGMECQQCTAYRSTDPPRTTVAILRDLCPLHIPFTLQDEPTCGGRWSIEVWIGR